MVRFAGLCHAAATLCLAIGLAAPASAQDPRSSVDDRSEPAPQQSAAPARLDAAAPAVRPSSRPAALIPLYASFAALQALDMHSTSSALARGAVESNPAMRGLTSNTFAMVAVKAAGTAGLIVATEKIRKKNRAAAVMLMIGANSAMAWVVEHNYRAAR